MRRGGSTLQHGGSALRRGGSTLRRQRGGSSLRIGRDVARRLCDVKKREMGEEEGRDRNGGGATSEEGERKGQNETKLGI